MARILFCGDPHGEWRPLLRAAEKQEPDAVVIVGDCDLARPLRVEIAPIWEAGIPVRYIPGNHDSDNEEWWDNLVTNHETGNLHGRVEEISGVRVAGLGGIFRGTIWYPQGLTEEERGPRFRTREAYVSTLSKGARWRNWVPRKHRSSIFPEDFDLLLEAGRADILVCHEAPSAYRHERPGRTVEGVAEIDVLAESLGARLIVHGHHHHCYSARLEGGIEVKGLSKGEPWLFDL